MDEWATYIVVFATPWRPQQVIWLFKSSQWTTTLKPLESILGNGIIKSWAGVTSDSSVSKRSNFGPPLGRNNTARSKFISAYARLSRAGFQQKDGFIGIRPRMKDIIEHEKRCIFCLLHSQAVTGSLCKGNQIPFQEGINVPEPTLGNKLIWVFVYYTRGSVCMKYADMLTGTYMHNGGFRFV